LICGGFWISTPRQYDGNSTSTSTSVSFVNKDFFLIFPFVTVGQLVYRRWDLFAAITDPAMTAD
jgi:hypothetical protein